MLNGFEKGSAACKRRIMRVATGFALVALGCTAALAESAKPFRIVSLNLCIDDLVLRLARPEHIASVTWLSHDPRNSNVAELARRVGKNHGLAEEIVPLDPDLVLAGTFSTRTAVALLKRTPIRVVELGIPNSFADIRQQIGTVAKLIDETARGELLIREMDARLAAIPRASGPHPRAIVFNPNGATVGRDTLVGEVMALAGLENVAAELGIDNYGTVPLEHVVQSNVDILIVSASRDGPPSLATEILHHPVLAKISNRLKIVSMPARLWNCGGPAAVGAVEFLRGVAETAKRERAGQ